MPAGCWALETCTFDLVSRDKIYLVVDTFLLCLLHRYEILLLRVSCEVVSAYRLGSMVELATPPNLLHYSAPSVSA